MDAREVWDVYLFHLCILTIFGVLLSFKWITLHFTELKLHLCSHDGGLVRSINVQSGKRFDHKPSNLAYLHFESWPYPVFCEIRFTIRWRSTESLILLKDAVPFINSLSEALVTTSGSTVPEITPASNTTKAFTHPMISSTLITPIFTEILHPCDMWVFIYCYSHSCQYRSTMLNKRIFSWQSFLLLIVGDCRQIHDNGTCLMVCFYTWTRLKLWL